ncbi:MAG TPA: nucleotidyltransferase family protein [Candidatus Saccharimonadales bacterium]|nr:nucleotidyltransferase family protein [Candidatus Saccharimonadales bacterium]
MSESGGLTPPVTRGILSLWAREGKWADITLSGLSMSPLIPDGARLTVRFGRSGLAVGDVVLYTTPAHLIAHRVLRLGRGGRRWGWVKVKGDPVHPTEAAWIPVEDVVGRVVAVSRPDGSRMLLNTSTGRVAGRLSAAISGPVAWVEGKLLRLVRPGKRLILTPLLLRLPAALHDRAAAADRPGFIRLGPAERFLVAAASLRMDPPGVERLRRLLARDPAWERIVPDAAALGLAPVAYRNLQRPDLRDLVPPAARAALGRAAHGSACLMAIQLAGLDRILDAFRTEGLDPVLLKGAALALTLYEQSALRAMKDIDLLVRPEEVGRAVSILERLGFRAIRTSRKPSFYASHHHAVPMIDPSGRLIVEIHRGIVPPSGGLDVDPAPLLARSVRVTKEGRSCRVLAVEDQLLHASLHLSYTDRFLGRLRDLLDIHALVESSGGLDWGIVIESARSWEASRSLYATLDLSRRIIGTSVPAEVLSELLRGARWDPVAAGAVRALARRNLFTGSDPGRLFSDRLVRGLCDTLLRRPRWSSRILSLLGAIGRQEHLTA